MKIVQLKRTATLQQDAARCNMKQHEKSTTVHHEKRCNTISKECHAKKGAIRKERNSKKRCSMKKTCKKCNLEKL